MRGLILALLLALTGTRADSEAYLDPTFSQSKDTFYAYEAVILTGLLGNEFVRAGISIDCKLQISPYSQRTYLLKALSLTIKEINGAWPKDPFTRSSKLTQAIAEQLTKPFKFEYHNGSIGNVYASNEVSSTVVNLIKGMLNAFNLNIKKSQNVYDLQEASIGGVCHTRYVIQEDKKGDQMVVVKSIDFNNCQDKAAKYIGMEFLEHCATCDRIHRVVRDAATFTYKMKNREHNTIITQVTSEQVILYAPFKEHNSGAVVEAKQILTFTGTKSSQMNTPQLQLQNRGNLQYNFEDELHQMPFVLMKTKSIEAQIVETLQYLVQNMQQKIPKDVSDKFVQLVQLLRHATHGVLQTIWKQFAEKSRYRSWILQALPMTRTADGLKMIYLMIHNGDLTNTEACNLLRVALLYTRGSQQALHIAQDIIKDSKVNKNPALFKVAMIGYGSMVKKYCDRLSTCPESVLDPIQDLAAEALSKAHEEDMTLALKAQGNTAQPECIKRIQKFLPGFSSSAHQLPVRVQVDAVMALRNIAKNDNHRVQEILMNVYMNRDARTEVRMVASLALLESKPNLAMVASIANVAVRESKNNLQLASFVYSQLKALAKSSMPQLEPLAAASSVALKLFNPSIDSLGYGYSKVIRMDSYKYPLMSGAAAEVYMMNSANTMFPVFILAKITAQVADAVSDVIEVGIRGEGIEQMLIKQDIQFHNFPMRKKIYQIVKILKGYKSQPSQTPLVSAYVKVSGQEHSFTQINKDTIQAFTQALNEPADRHAAVKNSLNKLLNGLAGQYAWAIMASETRRVSPTTVGLPIELSVYSTAVANAPLNIDMKMNPAYTTDFSIAQLMESQLQINADISPSLLIHVVSTVGINTPFIQSGIEFHGKAHANIPGKFMARVDMKERNIKFEAQPFQQEDDLLHISAQTYAVSRNVEELDNVKMIPLVPKAASQSILQKHFESKGRASAEGASMMASSEIRSKRDMGLANVHRSPYTQLFKRCIKIPRIPIQVCLNMHFRSAAARKDSIFYRAVGNHDIRVTMKPAHTDAAIEKIQVEESEIQKRLKTIPGIEDDNADHSGSE